MKIIDSLTKKYENIPDLIKRELDYNKKTLYLFYIETICSSDSVNDFILKNITNPNEKKNLKDLLATPNLKEIKNSEIDKYLFNGFTIIIYEEKTFALETRANLDRSIDNPQIEADLFGAKDALVENYQKNVGLVKRRIKSNHLKIKEYTLGRYTNTKTGVLYIDNIAEEKYLNKLDEILTTIDIDSIIDPGELKQLIIKDESNFFPSTKLTERPDSIVKALLEGKIVIMVDTSPFAIIIPAVLADFINPVTDTYIRPKNVNFIKILRLLCLFVSIFTPAYYIAIVNFNQEAIPARLLSSFITQRQGVPFPATIEAFFMLFICEMLRESDIRFPNSYGSSISVLGALILGEAAVSANIVSPIMIIIISLTFISSMVFSNIEFNGAIRSWRFISLLISSFFGLYGLFLSFIFLIVELCSHYSFKLSYTFPVAPFDLTYLKKTLFKGKDNKKRSKFLTKNIRKEK